MRQPLGRHQSAIGDAAGEARAFRPQQLLAHARVDAVGTDQEIAACDRAIVEMHLDGIAAAHIRLESMVHMQTLWRQRVDQSCEQIGTMDLIVRRAERRLHGARKRGTQQGAAVIPASLVEG